MYVYIGKNIVCTGFCRIHGFRHPLWSWNGYPTDNGDSAVPGNDVIAGTTRLVDLVVGLVEVLF